MKENNKMKWVQKLTTPKLGGEEQRERDEREIRQDDSNGFQGA